MSEKFYVIPEYEHYSISRNLNVKHNESGVILDKIGNDNRLVIIDDQMVSVPKLYAMAFIGNAPFSIIPGNHDHVFTYACPNSITQLNDTNYDLSGVLFKKIPGFSRYIISENGVVYDLIRKCFIHRSFNHGGYAVVGLTDDSGFRSPRKVHRMIYLAFIGLIPKGITVDHRDNKRWHNEASNLQLLTPGENAIKAFKEGASIARWTDEQIHTICRMLSDGRTNREIAKAIDYDYDADRPTLNHIIFMIRHGRIHNKIASQYTIDRYKGTMNRADSIFTINDVKDIRQSLSNGARIIDLAHQYHCTTSTIAKIRDRKTWKFVNDA